MMVSIPFHVHAHNTCDVWYTHITPSLHSHTHTCTLTHTPTHTYTTHTHTHTNTLTLTHIYSELKGSTLSTRLHKLGHNFTAPSKTKILRQIAEVCIQWHEFEALSQGCVYRIWGRGCWFNRTQSACAKFTIYAHVQIARGLAIHYYELDWRGCSSNLNTPPLPVLLVWCTSLCSWVCSSKSPD